MKLACKTSCLGHGVQIVMLVLLVSVRLLASQKHEATGLLLEVDTSRQTIVVSCQEIPGYMEAMVMSFTVQDRKTLEDLQPGMMVDFSLVVDKDSSYVENIHLHPFESLELDPEEARRFKLTEKAIAGKSRAADVLRIGQTVPNFNLTDQNRKHISSSQFSGKVVAVTFIYTRCPLPNYCVRLANNLGQLQKRFKDRMGRDLVLLTIVIDPVHDQPEALAEYARTWKADARTWHFLTGPVTEIQQLCHKFDMNFYSDEALMVHSFHTVIIDRRGALAANLDGNNFTAQQLGDLVQTVIARPRTPG